MSCVSAVKDTKVFFFPEIIPIITFFPLMFFKDRKVVPVLASLFIDILFLVSLVEND